MFVCRTKVELSFLDRLRVLITGRIEIETRTSTENVIGKSATASTFTALPWKWMERNG
jgi:hypothetical protein